MKGKKVLRIISKALGILLLAIVIMMFGLGAYKTISKYLLRNDMPKIFGYASAIVVSGSMEPEISIDDMVIIKEMEEYVVGEIVTYKSGTTYITHRIVLIDNEEYTLKGDANNTIDDPVSKDQIVGKVVNKIGGIGKVLYWFQTPVGMVVALVILLLIVFSDSIVSKIIKKKKTE